jgi:hypothetical protein
MLGNGDATFETTQVVNGQSVPLVFHLIGISNANPIDVRIVDLNDDGRNDIVTANGTDPFVNDSLSVFINTTGD